MSVKGNVLVVDDEESLRTVLRSVLTTAGYDVVTAEEGTEALNVAQSQTFHVAIVDKLMPRMDGLEVIRRLKEIQPGIVPVMLTAHGTMHDAVEAGRLGALDFLTKPFDNANVLLVVKLAAELSRARGELDVLKSEQARRNSVGAILGESTAMQLVRKQILKVARVDTTVLILGESGTGKELAARAIHYESARKKAPFIVINCASISPELIQAELFGHEKGAFTDAHTQRAGSFESADGGSVFLDEIGELPLEAQANLLRVLQEKEIVRLGSATPIPVNVRIIAATNRSLEEMVAHGTFRHDLLFRLNVAQIVMPPLREHREDIPLYAQHFVQKNRSQIGTLADTISPEALERLTAGDWQGNIRELENCIQRGLLHCEGRRLELSDIGEAAGSARAHNPHHDPQELCDDAVPGAGSESGQRALILNVLEETRWNRTLAAQRLHMSRRALFTMIRKLGLR